MLILDVNYSFLTSGNVHCRYLKLFLHYRCHKWNRKYLKFNSEFTTVSFITSQNLILGIKKGISTSQNVIVDIFNDVGRYPK